MFRKFLATIVVGIFLLGGTIAVAQDYPYRTQTNPQTLGFLHQAKERGFTILGAIDDPRGDVSVWMENKDGLCVGFILDNTDYTYQMLTCESLKALWDVCVAELGCENPGQPL
jgi:hypothetical protein